MMAKIDLSTETQAIVDDDMADLIRSMGPWSQNKAGYVMNSAAIYLHHVVLPLRPGFITDHRHGNKLDNRRSKLRRVTTSQNQMNARLPINSTSGIKGVSWDKVNRRWRAHIKVDGKMTTLGRFVSKDDAAAARRRAEVEMFGEFAYATGSTVGDSTHD